MRTVVGLASLFVIGALVMSAPQAAAQHCDVPLEARDVWHCQNGFVMGPENVIVRLPIPETDPEALYNAGIEAAGRQDWRVAIAYFTAAHQRAHLVPKYMYNLGLAHARAGHGVTAVAYLSGYLLADPNAPDRAAVWAQIAQLEADARREADVLWQRTETAAQAFARANGMNRMQVYADLARTAAEAGESARVMTFARLKVRASYEDGHLDEAAAEEEASHLLFDAAEAAYYDYDIPSIQRITASMPEDRRSSTSSFVYNLTSGAIRPALPVVWPIYIESAYSLGPFDNAVYSDVVTAPSRMNSVRASATMGLNWSPRERLSAMAVLGRTEELFAVLRRFENGDWSADRFDAELRQDDAQKISYGAYWERRDRGSDNLWRYRQGEIGAAQAGEVYLRMGDLRHAAAAADIARSIVAQGRRAAPSIDRDLADYDCRPDAASLLGWYSVRLDALLLAENGHVDDALALLNDFLARRSTRISRPVPDADTAMVYSFETGLPWAEARYLGYYAIADYLAHRGRLDEALQLAEGLDDMRREQLYGKVRQILPAAATRAPAANASASNGLIDLIISARTMSGAAYDLPAWLARIQATNDPNEQMRLLSAGASDIERGLRRTHALYASAGGTWGR